MFLLPDPYIMAKTRLHIKAKGGVRYTGTLDVLRQAFFEHGIGGLYAVNTWKQSFSCLHDILVRHKCGRYLVVQGLSAQIGKSVLGSAIMVFIVVAISFLNVSVA